MSCEFSADLSSADDGVRDSVHLRHGQTALERLRGARHQWDLDRRHPLRRLGHPEPVAEAHQRQCGRFDPLAGIYSS